MRGPIARSRPATCSQDRGGPKAAPTVIGTYNENGFNQPDKDGVTLGRAALHNQTTRYAQGLSPTYTADPPFATVDYARTHNLSAFRYATGFLAPSLGVLYVATSSAPSMT